MMSVRNVSVSKNGRKSVLTAVSFLVLILTIWSSIVIIPTSYVGIRRTFSLISDKPLLEGFHFKIPFIQSVEKQNIKTIQEEHYLSGIQAKDMQKMDVNYKVAYKIPFDKIISNAKTLQGSVYEMIIEPRVKEVMADIIVRYTAEEVIAKREEIAKLAKEQIMSKKEIFDRCDIEEVVVMKFAFTDPEFEKAINNKKRAVQYAEQAEIEKQTAKAKADQQIFEAEGKAKAIKLEAEAMKANAKIVEMKQIDASLKAIEKWDGKLPSVLITSGNQKAPTILNIDKSIISNK